VSVPFKRIEGKYEILSKMREGGMGAVYKVRHRLLDEIRVIKVMRPHLAADEVLRQRFVREAKTAIRLRHQNLAQLYDFTVDDEGNAFIVMEFIEGVTLQDLIKVHGPPGLGLALEISVQSLKVIGYLHRREVIHRDIAPDNLMLSRDEDGRPMVKLIDLGIAKVTEDEVGLTTAGTFLGKVRYSSPEQLRARDGVEMDARSDLYSFGIVFYELLTGRYPISGDSTSSIIAGHLLNPPLGFNHSDPKNRVSEALRSVVLKALEKEVEARYSSADSMRRQVRQFVRDNPVEDAELKKLFDSPMRSTQQIPVIKPGSTQGHLDRHFGIGSTPAPEAKESATEMEVSHTENVDSMIGSQGGGSSKADDERSQRQLRALLLGAEKLVELHHYDEARLQLRTVLDIDSSNADAERLMTAVNAADEKRKKRCAEVGAEAEKMAEALDFEGARRHLEDAESRHGADEIFEQARKQVDQAEKAENERLKKVAQLGKKAETAITNRRFADAVTAFEEAVRLAPEDHQLADRLVSAQQSHREQVEAERRAAEIARTAATISARLDNNQLDEAAHELELAQKLYGDEQTFVPLFERLEELQTAARERRAAELRSEAAELLVGDRHPEALKRLNEALELYPGDKRTLELVERVRGAMRRAEQARRRARAISDAITGAERLRLAGRFESAGAWLDSAIKELGEFDEADAERMRIDAAIAEKKKIDKSIRKTLDKVASLASSGKFDGALRALDDAREIATEHPEHHDEVNTTAGELSRQAEVHRETKAVAEAAANIEQQLGSENADAASRALEVATRLFGDREELLALRDRLAELRSKQRTEKAEQLLRDALSKHTSFTEIIKTLEQALEIDPDHERAQRMLAETRASLEQHRDEQREKAIAAAMEEIDRLIASGNNPQALSKLAALVKKHDDFPIARSIRHRLKGS